jgi:hypothetical protein
VYTEASLSTLIGYEWFSKFAAEDRNLQDNPRSGRSSYIDDFTLKAILKTDSHQTTTNLAKHLGDQNREKVRQVGSTPIVGEKKIPECDHLCIFA